MDWDDVMQKECAEAFIRPLQQKLIDQKNREKVAKAALAIILDENNIENESLLDNWFTVLEAVVGNLTPEFVSEHVIKLIKDEPGLKNPLPRR